MGADDAHYKPAGGIRHPEPDQDLRRRAEPVRHAKPGGARRSERLLRDLICAQPRSRVDYTACRDANSLEPVGRIDKDVVLATAVFFGTTRLIDNRVVKP